MFSVTDPNADPDADGQTNAQEEHAGTHPNGQVRRFLAEGATGAFFHTAIALANPNPTLAAPAVLTFDRGDGTRVRRLDRHPGRPLRGDRRRRGRRAWRRPTSRRRSRATACSASSGR